MVQPTEVTKASLAYLLDLPTRVKGDKEFLDGVSVWVHKGASHEEAQAGPGLATRVWWEGMRLCADVKVAIPGGDHIEFRYNKEPVWVVAAKIGNRKAFTFQQDFLVGKVKISPLFI